jgi:CMP-N,N'-diacetyllegionaminic acid synthase
VKVLVIGYGSIGRRHVEVLQSIDSNIIVDVVTTQAVVELKVYQRLEVVSNINKYDYFVIASETSKHFEQLKYICSQVTEKKVLVEKPLFDRSYDRFMLNNMVFVAYNLRFHPVIQHVKQLISQDEVYYANVFCGQYLPTWRPNRDYRTSYSADALKGGGVLRDLSHELDYAAWLFGDIVEIQGVNTKISDLEINSDDIFAATAISENKTIMNISVDYISKTPMRRMVIHAREQTIEADMIGNKVVSFDKKGNKEVSDFGVIERNLTYQSMHKAVLSEDNDVLCSYEEAEKTTVLIDKVSSAVL